MNLTIRLVVLQGFHQQPDLTSRISCICRLHDFRGDILAARDFRHEEDHTDRSWRIERLAEEGNMVPLLGLFATFVTTVYFDHRFKGAFVPFALIVLIGSVICTPIRAILRQCGIVG